MLDILRENDLLGLMYLSTQKNRLPVVREDTLHLNDIETFPANLASDLFRPGDIMISLRNINTVLVVDSETLGVKFRTTGIFLRQHDPDFMANDVISVFDNRNLLPSTGPEERHSRIIEIDARTGEAHIVLSGRGEVPFFTAIMGVHQRLANGNALVTSSREGRLLELTADGELVWEYQNRIDGGRNGLLTQGQVLPPQMDRAFFDAARAECS